MREVILFSMKESVGDYGLQENRSVMNSIYLHGDIENAMGFDIPRRTNVSDFSSLDDGIYSCIVDGNHCTLFYWKAVADYAPTGFINNGLVVSNGDFDSYDYAKKQYLAKNLEI